MNQDNTDNEKDLQCLSVEEVRQFLGGVSKTTIYNLVKQPGFPAIKLGPKKIVIPKNNLLAWIESESEKPL